jgi:hypothetical protein
MLCNATVTLRTLELSMEYWDCTDSPDYENILRILRYLSHLMEVPGDALTALERLLELAYPSEKTAYRCRMCGELILVPKTPGKRPSTLCKKVDCQRAANRERVQRYRARRSCASPAPERSSPPS